MQDQLGGALRSWNGKETAPLETVFAAHHQKPEFLERLVEFSASEGTERAATWLLKHHFDQGGAALSEALSGKHLLSASKLRHWEARLHVLQYLEMLKIPGDAEQTLERFIGASLKSDKKFERAWAFHALALLAERFPGQKDRVLDQLRAADSRETAGSVKVRIRKALERLNK